jgi:hypothetical protein
MSIAPGEIRDGSRPVACPEDDEGKEEQKDEDQEEDDQAEGGVAI